MADYEFRKAGVAFTLQDFGRITAGMTVGPITVQLVNTSLSNWVDLRLSMVQGDSDGGYGTASVGAVTLTPTPVSVGPLAIAASVNIALGWVTPAGTVGRVADLAALNFEADY